MLLDDDDDDDDDVIYQVKSRDLQPTFFFFFFKNFLFGTYDFFKSDRVFFHVDPLPAAKLPSNNNHQEEHDEF